MPAMPSATLHDAIGASASPIAVERIPAGAAETVRLLHGANHRPVDDEALRVLERVRGLPSVTAAPALEGA